MSELTTDDELRKQVKRLMENFASDAVKASKTPMGFAYGSQVDDVMKLIQAHSQRLVKEADTKARLDEWDIASRANVDLYDHKEKRLAQLTKAQEPLGTLHCPNIYQAWCDMCLEQLGLTQADVTQERTGDAS